MKGRKTISVFNWLKPVGLKLRGNKIYIVYPRGN